MNCIHSDCGEERTVLLADMRGEVEPCYEPVCGMYQYHYMVSSGFGTVYKEDGSTYILLASAWQCKRCMLVMVTEGDIIWGEMTTIGKYATYHGYVDPINTNGCIIWGADHYGYTSNNYLSGYRFVIPTYY